LEIPAQPAPAATAAIKAMAEPEATAEPPAATAHPIDPADAQRRSPRTRDDARSVSLEHFAASASTVVHD
jgi:hypothetical protein